MCLWLQGSIGRTKSFARCAPLVKSQLSTRADSASLRGSYYYILYIANFPSVVSYSKSSAILKYLVKKYSLPDHWYPQDVQRQAKIDEYLGWHGTNLRRGAGSQLAHKVHQFYTVFTHTIRI